ncbi:MAG TPA: ferredoxin--NADP reductase [Flavisolibacter sp.]|nr:ferredoxin--NADP reductase [Flavisolibacter sp.]
MQNPETGLYKRITIANIEEEVKGFISIKFNEGHLINYKAGQYLTLIHIANNEEIRRSYSITSTPELKEQLSIGIKRIENGYFSRQLVDNARVGDEIITIGAGGFFTLPDNISVYKQVIFFAAGSGITPILSLLKSVLYNYPFINAVLIYSSQSKSETIFYEALEQLYSQFTERFTIRYLFSNSPDLQSARLHRDLLEEILLKHIRVRPEQVLFFICGPESYMRLCTYVLQENHYPKNNIRRENFVIQKLATHVSVPGDHKSYLAEIFISDKRYIIEVNYPDSILKAAKKAGVLLPYSCEAGRCGNCVAKCIKGNVWLSYNEVLTDEDINKGLTLTCVGHPYNGNIVLEI